MQNQVVNYKDNSENIPATINNNPATHPYFRKLKTILKNKSKDEIAEITLHIYDVIAQNKKVDFHKKIDIKKKVLDILQDYFIDELNLTDNLSYDEINQLAETMWNIAVANR